MRLLSMTKSSLSLQHAPAARRPQPRDHAAEHRRGLGLLFLQRGAQDRGEIADILGDEEIVLHEALDIPQAGMLRYSRAAARSRAGCRTTAAPRRGRRGNACCSGPPTGNPRSGGTAVFVAVEHAALDQFLGLAHAIDVFRDPEQRVQVAQAALAVLDVGLDQIARLAGAAVALLALGELGGDEFGARCPAPPPCRTAPSARRRAAASPSRKRASRIAVRIVMSALAWRMHSSTERVAWPTFSPMSHRQ